MADQGMKVGFQFYELLHKFVAHYMDEEEEGDHNKKGAMKLPQLVDKRNLGNVNGIIMH
ncbi:hypothetical protein [Niallia circulans]|uniref:hypothetical protein n=1 Tax=Niallia circulans TaxID=1397 RepID=UPI0035265A1F